MAMNWNQKWYDNVNFTNEFFKLPGFRKKGISKYSKKIEDRNGICISSFNDDASVAILGSLNFSSNIDEYKFFEEIFRKHTCSLEHGLFLQT